jgi:uncharacterized membrane protein
MILHAIPHCINERVEEVQDVMETVKEHDVVVNSSSWHVIVMMSMCIQYTNQDLREPMICTDTRYHRGESIHAAS